MQMPCLTRSGPEKPLWQILPVDASYHRFPSRMSDEELKSQHNAKVKKTTQEHLLEALSTSYHPAVGLL